ncbi:MAG: FAD-dependent oxidoreductase, partial [Bdellovibrionota bacterium]
VEKNRAVGVRLASGEEFRAPAIVSDAGAANTFAKLLPREIAKKSGLLQKLETVPTSIAYVCLYVGLDGTAEEIGLPKTNFWIYPDEKHDQNYERAVSDLNAPFPVVYISFPSAKDPTFTKRYPGKSTVEIITAVPYEFFSKWEGTKWRKRGEDYETLKAKLSERLLEKLYGKLPQTRGKVAYHELSTPLSVQHFSNYAKGETYGLSHGPERFTQNFLRVRTPVDGLYLTGQDLVTCGVTAALMGGVFTAGVIGGMGLLRDVMAGAPAPQGVSRAAA